MHGEIDLDFFRPRARTCRLNSWFIDRAVNYAKELLGYMENLRCIEYKWDEKTNSLSEIIIRIDCPLWYSMKNSKIHIKIES